MRKMLALIIELEEEVQLPVADRDAMVEEAHQTILERDRLIDKCRPLNATMLQIEARDGITIMSIAECASWQPGSFFEDSGSRFPVQYPA